MGLGALVYTQHASDRQGDLKARQLIAMGESRVVDSRHACLLRTGEFDPSTDGSIPKVLECNLHAAAYTPQGQAELRADALGGLAGRLFRSQVADPNAKQLRQWDSVYEGNWGGAFRGQNTIYSEETRIFRPDSIQPGRNASIQASRASEELTGKNTVLGVLGAFPENRRTTLPSNTNSPQLLGVPNSHHPLAALPSAYAFREGASRPLDNRTELYRDQFGIANATPVDGPGYPWTGIQYWGNPWGVGGAFAEQFRVGGTRNTGFNGTTDRQLIPAYDFSG